MLATKDAHLHDERDAFKIDGTSSTDSAFSYLPQVLVATTLAAVIPAALVWGLHADGIISEAWICLGLAVVLSLIASFAGSAYWMRRRRAGDVLFSDLLVWGWLRRVYVERQIARVIPVLGQLGSSEPGESAEQRVRLLKQLAIALDAKDPYLNGHSRRVARYATGTAHRMGLLGEQAVGVQTAAAIHDVGKLHTPPEILGKAGRLTDAEVAIMRRHADDGAAMVAGLGDSGLEAIVRHHHERFDGTGYPSGLKGAQIPLGARIIAVADTFDAITSDRPYRPGLAHKQALDVLATEAGHQFDPVPVRAFIAYYSGRRGSVLWSLATSPQNAFARTLRSGMAAALTAVTVGVAAVTAVPLGVAHRHGRRPLLVAVTGTTAGVTGSITRATEALMSHENSARVGPSHGAVRRRGGNGSIRTRAPQIPRRTSSSYSVPVIAAVSRSIGTRSASTTNGVFSGFRLASRAPASSSPASQTTPPLITVPSTPPPGTPRRTHTTSPHPKPPASTQPPSTQPPSTQPEPAPTNPTPPSTAPSQPAPPSSTPPATTPQPTTPAVTTPPTTTPPSAPPSQPEPPTPPIPPTAPPGNSGNQGDQGTLGQGDQGQGNGGVPGRGPGNQGQGDQGQGNGGLPGQGQGNQANAH